MTILVDAALLREELVGAESTEGPFDEFYPLVLGRVLSDGCLHADEPVLNKIAEQDAYDADWHLYEGSAFSNGAFVAHLEYLERGSAHSSDLGFFTPQGCLHGEVHCGMGSPGGHGVRPDEARSAGLFLRTVRFK